MAQSLTMGRLYRSTVALKAVMGVTGVAMFGWLIAHMLGNLQVFAGAETMNKYAKFLHDNASVLWVARVAMLGAIALHVFAAVALTTRNKAARPQRYRVYKSNKATFASRSMIYTGPLITLYIVFHLAHMTFGVGVEGFDKDDVYANLVTGLSSIPVALIYIAANVAIGIHLWHGAWSFFQSLGWTHRKYDQLRRYIAYGVSGVISTGFIAVAISIMVGVVK